MPLFFLVLLFISFCGRAEVRPYFVLDSFSYSETVSIKSTLDGWKTDQFTSGKRQWTWNWAEAGITMGKWGVGLLQRYDYALNFSEDAARFYWLVANKADLPVGEEFDVRVDANVVHTTGLRLSFSDFFTPDLNYTLGLSYLYATYMIDGELKGTAQVIGESDYDYQAEVFYHYSEDLLFDREVERPVGHGFAFDARVGYQLGQSGLMSLEVRDLLTRIYWRNCPYTNGGGSSSRKEYDEDGYLSLNPVLSGYEGNDHRYTQTLPARWYLKYEHQLFQKVRAVGQYRYQYDHGLFGLGGEISFSSLNRLSLSYWPLNEALELGVKYHDLMLGISADQLSASRLKTFWLSFSYLPANAL